MVVRHTKEQLNAADKFFLILIGTVREVNKGTLCIERKNATFDGTGDSWKIDLFP